MKLKQHALAAGFALAAVFSSSAFAEQSIQEILGSDWSVVTDFSTLPSWNTAGTTLKFTLASENTANYATQTFGIVDGVYKSIFTGASDASSPSFIYTVTSGLTNAVFSGNYNPSIYNGSNLESATIQIWSNSTHTSYALGFEDWVDHDFQDMVVKVSAVPEPETYAMMLAGLGLMGFVARRKQQK